MVVCSRRRLGGGVAALVPLPGLPEGQDHDDLQAAPHTVHPDRRGRRRNDARTTSPTPQPALEPGRRGPAVRRRRRPADAGHTSPRPTPSASARTTTGSRPRDRCWTSTTSCAGWSPPSMTCRSPSGSHSRRSRSNRPGASPVRSGHFTRGWRGRCVCGSFDRRFSLLLPLPPMERRPLAGTPAGDPIGLDEGLSGVVADLGGVLMSEAVGGPGDDVRGASCGLMTSAWTRRRSSLTGIAITPGVPVPGLSRTRPGRAGERPIRAGGTCANRFGMETYWHEF
jgi:hypothetical protein